MHELNIRGKKYILDENGFLADWQSWTKEVAEAFAKDDNITLTPEHWEIINFLREYYKEYKVAPPMRMLVKEVEKILGTEKGNMRYLYKLFPLGPAKMSCKYAGLPKPSGCV